jgi:2-polyprenyl-6-methoxyphenol hydroxylase-like FAD-dependent oxidoreductase
VLVVGAGPTGLTAAVELSRLGVEVRIVDRAAGPSTTSKALAVQARTIELLEPRGVGRTLLEQGAKARAATLYGRGKKLAAVRLDEIPSRINGVVLLPQSDTERLLSEQLERQGVKVERGVELVSFAQNAADPEAGVRCVLKDREGGEDVLDAAYLISAEGSHSSVRQALGIAFDGNAGGQRYMLADLHLDGDVPDDELSIFLAADGFLAVFPMGGQRFRLMATDLERSGLDSVPPTPPELQQVVDRVAPIPIRLHDIGWSSRFFINSRHASTLRVGRVFLGGDAAHIHSPAGGQGMNTGIQDMINLCWKLALVLRGDARPALLDTYEADRLPIISALIRSTERATAAFNSTNPIVHQLITRIAPIALATDRVQNQATAVLGQTSVHYRNSPLTEQGGRAGRLRAGDRVPDVDVRVVDGEPAAAIRRLYELLDLSRPTLLVTDPDADLSAITAHLLPWHDVLTVRHVTVAGAQPALRGLDVRIAADLAAHPGLLLVRPDGYVAAIAAEPSGVAGWFDHWFAARGGAAC